MYMREYWVQVHKSPIVYRYVDWRFVNLHPVFTPATKVTNAPVCRDVCQWERTVAASKKKKNVAAIIAMEMIQKEMATPSVGCRNASAGWATGAVDDIGAPIADNNPKAYSKL